MDDGAGGVDLGRIDEDAAQAAGRAPGPIRMLRARLAEHSTQLRAAQIRRAGYGSESEFVRHVARGYGAIYEGSRRGHPRAPEA